MTTPTTVPVRLQLRADTAANWTSVNPILLANELGRETDTGKIKIGNGTSTWTSLAYQAWATLPVAVNAGGTGQTSYTNGQLLIGNTTGNTLTKATLTAGSGVAITNGTGSITVAVDSTVVTTAQTGTVTSTMIADGTIVDADVNASAAIAGTKISPNFGSQNVVTTGTSTAASLIPTGSTVPGNGVYLPAANSVGISTNGTERMRLDSTGRLGLGTSSPGQLLEIASASNPQMRFTDIGDYFYDIGITDSNKFTIAPAGTSALTVVAAGLVGIGTTSPGAGLHIVSTGQAAESLDTSQNINLLVADSGGSPLNGGSVVFGASNGAWRFAAIKGLVTSGGNNTAGHLTFLTRNASTDSTLTERLRINANGRIGIGTTAPGGRLNVQAETGEVPFLVNGPSSEFVRIDSSGRLLVGTASDSGGALFQVNGDRVRIATAKTPASSGATGTTGEIAWDADYIYVCTATNTWKRTAISTW
jgi:hypothetical protein